MKNSRGSNKTAWDEEYLFFIGQAQDFGAVYVSALAEKIFLNG